jgi:N-methylhydantoinase A
MLVNLVTTLIGHRPALDPGSLIAGDERATSLEGACLGERPVWFGDGWRSTPVYDRTRLPLGCRLAGPAIVQQLDATSVIEPGDEAELDRLGNLLISVGPGDG